MPRPLERAGRHSASGVSQDCCTGTSIRTRAQGSGTLLNGGNSGATEGERERGVDRVNMPAQTVFDIVGGQPFFDALVERFYGYVESDRTLRRLYPDDLEPGKRSLALFLGQYWGGP